MSGVMAPGSGQPAAKIAIPAVAWWILILASLDSVLGMIDRQAVAILKTTLKDVYGMGDAQFGVLVMGFLLAYALFFPICGKLIDRFGSRRVLTACIVIWSLASILSGMARSFEELAACRVLLGAAEAGLTPATLYALVRWFPRDRLATVYALRGPIVAFGPILAPVVIAFLALTWGWQSAFVLPGAIGFLFAIAWWFADRNPPDYGEPAAIVSASPLKALMKSRLLWGLVAARMISDPAWFFIQYWQAGYFEEVLGLDLRQVGSLLWIPPLAASVLIIALSAWSDRLVRAGGDIVRSRVVVMQWMALLSPLFIAIPFVTQLPVALALFTGAHLLSFGFITLSLILVGSLFPKDQVATAAGIVNCVGTLAAAGFNLIAGTVVEQAGYVAVFVACALLHPLAAAVLFGFFRRGKMDRSYTPT